MLDIITITYNNYTGLKKTYESLKNQSYTKFHWIVVDGNSSDESKAFLKEIKDKNYLNMTFVSEKDDGVYDAMNKGIEISKHQYLLFLNAGDCLYDKETLTKIFNENILNYKLIYGDYLRENSDNGLSYVKAKNLKYIYHSLPTSHQAIIYHKRFFNTIKYNTEYKICGDYDLTCRIVKDFSLLKNNDYKILHFPMSIFEYNGVSTQNKVQLFYEAYMVQKRILKLNVFWRVTSYILKYIRSISL